jgi:hypothetical protein
MWWCAGKLRTLSTILLLEVLHIAFSLGQKFRFLRLLKFVQHRNPTAWLVFKKTTHKPFIIPKYANKLESWAIYIHLFYSSRSEILVIRISEVEIWVDCAVRADVTSIVFLLLSCHLYRCLSLNDCWALISELTITHLNDRMVNSRNRWGDAEAHHANGPNLPPPPTLA